MFYLMYFIFIHLPYIRIEDIFQCYCFNCESNQYVEQIEQKMHPNLIAILDFFLLSSAESILFCFNSDALIGTFRIKIIPYHQTMFNKVNLNSLIFVIKH